VAIQGKEKQIEIIKKMTPQKKLQVAVQQIYSARKLRMAILKKQFPDSTPHELEQKLREIFLYART